jgi:hypothetical protein
VRGILGDVSCGGQYRVLVGVLNSETFREFWQHLGLEALDFADVDLAPNAVDSAIWHTCQREGLVLITANRNAAGPNSFEATIRTFNAPHSLPVLTIANARRVPYDSSYAEAIVERILDYLLDIDNYLGAGRLYVP